MTAPTIRMVLLQPVILGHKDLSEAADS